jgi:hypothetical protein
MQDVLVKPEAITELRTFSTGTPGLSEHSIGLIILAASSGTTQFHPLGL